MSRRRYRRGRSNAKDTEVLWRSSRSTHATEIRKIMSMIWHSIYRDSVCTKTCFQAGALQKALLTDWAQTNYLLGNWGQQIDRNLWEKIRKMTVTHCRSYHMVESLPGNCLIWLSVKRYIYNLVRYAYLLYPVSVHVFLIVYEYNVS